MPFFWRLVVTLVTLCAYGSVYCADSDKGWQGEVQLGAIATFGETNSSAVSALSSFSFRSIRWEHEIEAKYYNSSNESLVSVRDENNELARDANGNEIKRTERNTTNNRRYLSAESRWYFTPRIYLFGVADLDVNKPANLSESSRAVAGIGYKVYENKKNYVSAGVGMGRKKRIEESGDSESASIAYLTFSFKRELDEKLILGMDWDSDFSADDRYSEAEVSLSWKVREPLSLKIQYETRFNSTPLDPLNTFDDGYQGVVSISLAYDIF